MRSSTPVLEDSTDNDSTEDESTSYESSSLSEEEDGPEKAAAVPTSSLADAEVAQSSALQPQSLNAGYKLVFDNIDKNVKPRYMRCDAQTKSLHYVQVYGVKDRIDYSLFTSEHKTDMNLYSILPTSEDYESLKRDFGVLISRIMHRHLPFFGNKFRKLVQRHIPHQYSAEMCKKSEVVSLRVCLLWSHLLWSELVVCGQL